MTKQEGFLDKVYDLDDAEKTQALYRDWAKSYDEELRASGYASPARTAAAMAAQVADVTAPLLDLGCGTGLAGQAFRNAGFITIDGTDFTEEMLEAAKAKGIYRKLTLGDLNDPIPAQPGDYANIAAVGVFSPGHAPAEMIDLVFGLLPQGGCFGFSLNDHALEEASYEGRVKDLAVDGTLEVAFQEYGDHLPKIDLKSKIYVLRKL